MILDKSSKNVIETKFLRSLPNTLFINKTVLEKNYNAIGSALYKNDKMEQL